MIAACVVAGQVAAIMVVPAAPVAFTPSSITPVTPRLRPGVNILFFSGALVGVLHVSPTSDCRRALPHGVTLNIRGKLRGSTSSAWEIQVVSSKSGTVTLPEGENAGVLVSSDPQDQVWGSNSDGTMSVSGSSGSVDVELWSADAGKIHLAGAWRCPPTQMPAPS